MNLHPLLPLFLSLSERERWKLNDLGQLCMELVRPGWVEVSSDVSWWDVEISGAETNQIQGLEFFGTAPLCPPLWSLSCSHEFSFDTLFFSNAKEISLLSIHNHEAATSVEYSGVTGLWSNQPSVCILKLHYCSGTCPAWNIKASNFTKGF